MLEDQTVLVCEDSNKVFAEYGYWFFIEASKGDNRKILASSREENNRGFAIEIAVFLYMIIGLINDSYVLM